MRKYTIEYVREYFESKGCTLISTEYIGVKYPLDYQASCGHKHTKTFDNFKNNKSEGHCPTCGYDIGCKDKRYTIEKISQIFNKEGCKLISKEYTNVFQRLEFECSCGNISEISLQCFMRGDRCGCKRPVGSQHKWYNPTVPDHIKNARRDGNINKLWAKSIYSKDNYTCQCCSKYGGTLNAHHKENYATNPSLRTDIDNGVTLCDTCHRAFHQIYGKSNNTEEQLNEFIQCNSHSRLVTTTISHA